MAIASVAFVLLIITGLFLFLRQRRRKKHATETSVSSLTPILPMQGIEELEPVRPSTLDPKEEGATFPFSPPALPSPTWKARTNFKRTSGLSIAPSYYGNSNFPDEMRSQTASQALDPPIPPVPRLKIPRNPASSRSTPDTVAAVSPHSNGYSIVNTYLS